MKQVMWIKGRAIRIPIDEMDRRKPEVPPVYIEFKSKIAHGFHKLQAEHFGETYEIESQISRDGRMQIKVRIWPGIGNDKIAEKLESGETKRGTIIKLDPENLPGIPEDHYYPELVHDNEHFPVNEHMEHWKRLGLLKAV